MKNMTQIELMFAVAACVVALTACGSDDGGSAGDAAGPGADGGPADAGVVRDAGPRDSGTEDPAMLDPHSIQKFVSPLVVPGVMPFESKTPGLTSYRIAVRQFSEQVLPDGMPKTKLFGYGRTADSSMTTYHSPALTIETRANEKVQIEWSNGLVDESGDFLPHFLPIDQTLHWANPPVDHMGESFTSKPYSGPIPVVTHVHGAHVADHSDGNPAAWFLPAAANIPQKYTIRGPAFASTVSPNPGTATFEYDGDQRAATLWYHDHTIGVTRVNVYAGMAGFWFVRDEEEAALGLPGPAPAPGDPAGKKYFELPLMIQDKSFHEDGSLFYPKGRDFFDGYAGPYMPDTPVPPIWNPETFGNTIVVNGKTWPYLEVEPRLYRLRLLNACNARFLILAFDHAGLPFEVIGTEGGLIADKPVTIDQLLMGPAERYDVLVDFSAFAIGTEVILKNLGPDEPYGGLTAPDAPPPPDPETTANVMKFKIVAKTVEGIAGSVPAALPAIAPLTDVAVTRDLTLNELVYELEDIPVSAQLGTADRGPLEYESAITETPSVNTTETWRLINLTEDAHPIHLHLVTFQVLDRTPFDAEAFAEAQSLALANGDPVRNVDQFIAGPAIPAYEWENGWKDTVLADPGYVTRVVAHFDKEGTYVWHCHILEHEDNEMMRPFKVVP